ncbi:hypothetical protein KR026_003623 [Drosophila bipectinata]|nr:hypothetical protein KR026_003623 [Drosophila bipectinata]
MVLRASMVSGKSQEGELLDGPTPRHSLLSGRYKQSFAYLSLRTRMPGIMQQIIIRIKAQSQQLVEQFGEDVLNDVKHIVDGVDRLKNELNRDRQFILFHGNEPDKAEWNAFLTELPRPKRNFFRACWLHAECYLYRRLYSFFENSRYLNGYDPFEHLKMDDLTLSKNAMKSLARATRGLDKSFDNFRNLLRIVLWSNHFERALGAYAFSEEESQNDINVLAQVADMDRNLLVDDSSTIWSCLNRKRPGSSEVIVDFICDNGGFEFFTDMLFLEYIIESQLATQVRLHVKAIPWYISDLMKKDIDWTIKYLIQQKDDILSSVGSRWLYLMKTEKIIVAPESHFWTGPQPYFVMVELDLELYKLLTGGRLVIFKGDLNYRKLLGDFIWDSAEEFITCLRGFRPTNIAAIRTVKCEVVCGLPEGMSDNLLRSDPMWMISSNYGLIQYTDSLKCACGLVSGMTCNMTNKEPPELTGRPSFGRRTTLKEHMLSTATGGPK